MRKKENERKNERNIDRKKVRLFFSSKMTTGSE